MPKTINTSDPSTWAPELDAVTAAPKNHKVLFENDRLRVLEVILEPTEEEPLLRVQIEAAPGLLELPL